MARLKDEVATQALQAHLHPGERLLHWAYGVKQPNIGLMLLLFALAILPGAIAVALMTKEYLIGLTDGRLVVLRFSGAKVNVKEVTEYALQGLAPRVKASKGGLFTHIKIEDPQRPFVAKFHRLGMTNNRDHSQAIADALTGGQAKAA
jgi:hypothetical protein